MNFFLQKVKQVDACRHCYTMCGMTESLQHAQSAYPKSVAQRLIKLVDIVKLLRSDKGCPWDREQTVETLTQAFLKEAKEVEEAVAEADHDHICEELGDILLTVLMITTVAEEKGFFTLKKVLEDVTEKVRSRHTWVFGKDRAKTPEEAIALWQKNKQKERAQKKK